MDKDETKALMAIIFGIFIVGLFLGFIVGTYKEQEYTTNKIRQEAIKAKVAEYYIDENNNKQFRFKEIGK